MLGYGYNYDMITKPGRNDKCLCGSGEKHKNCYGKQLDTCTVYANEIKTLMEKNHSEKDKMVFQFFGDTLEDIGTIFHKNQKGLEVVSSRVQLIAIFTLVDVLASYWYEYHNQTGEGKPRARFVSWMNEFCFTDVNKDFPGSEYQKITADRLYDFRSSLVHFFGLSRTDEDTFGIVPDDEEAKRLMEGFIKRQRNKGKTMYMVDSKKLHSLVSEGAILMLNGWSQTINEAQTNEGKKWSHIEGIDRIYKKVMLEGAVRVPYKPTEENQSS